MSESAVPLRPTVGAIRRGAPRRCLVLAVALSCGILLSAAWPGAAENSWSPSADLLSRLADPDPIGSFQIRPPIGYQAQEQVQESGDRVKIWVGARRKDQSRPFVMISIIRKPAPSGPATPEIALARLLASAHTDRRNWTQSKPESGTLAGLNFARAYWQATDTKTRRRMHGFDYVTLDGETVVHIASRDVAPHIREGLDLAEAAALTFARR